MDKHDIFQTTMVKFETEEFLINNNTEMRFANQHLYTEQQSNF